MLPVGCGRRVATVPQLCCHEGCLTRPLMVVSCLDSAIAITAANGSLRQSWNRLGLVSAAGLALAAASLSPLLPPSSI